MLDQAAAQAPAGVQAALSFAEQVAAMNAPAAIAAMAAKIDALEAKLAAGIGPVVAKHPIAAAAIVTANKLLAQMFPHESGFITALEDIDL